MLSYENYCKIKLLHDERKLNVTQIAQELMLDRRTVSRWLNAKNYHPRKNQERSSKLDKHKREIVRLLENHDYSGTQVLRILRAQGYDGGATILNEYIRKIRPKSRAAYLTLTFAPGECAQVDWGEFGSISVGNTKRRLSFFIMVLCHSRLMYLQFTLGQSMAHFLDCHHRAFNYFGGVPQRLMVDNLKCAVLRRLVGGTPQFNARYLDYAQHYGFKISPCNIAKGNEKGRVENAVGYVKKNLLRGLPLSTFTALEPLAKEWLEQVANIRIHGTTKKRPIDLFEVEKSALQALPIMPADTGVSHAVRANTCFRVTFETNRYSVPAEYASTRLRMMAYADALYFYYEQRLVARHKRCYDRHQDIEAPEHVRPLLAKKGRARMQKLLATFFRLCPEAEAYYQGLAQMRLNTNNHIRQIMALVEIYGAEKTVRALRDCLELHVFSSGYICNLLEQRERKLPSPSALHLTRREDLLELELPQADLSIYERTNKSQKEIPKSPSE